MIVAEISGSHKQVYWISILQVVEDGRCIYRTSWTSTDMHDIIDLLKLLSVHIAIVSKRDTDNFHMCYCDGCIDFIKKSEILLKLTPFNIDRLCVSGRYIPIHKAVFKK